MNNKGLIIGGSIIGAILLLIFISVTYFISIQNGFITKSEGIKSSWAQVENQMQRRADLIPNFVNTVKGYAAHEKGIFESIAMARSRLLSANTPEEKMQASNQMGGFLGRLMMITESYPNLKADANFRALQDELAGTENRLAVERKRYNDLVQEFNVSIKVFPASIIANMSGQKEFTYFKVEEQAKEVPQVKF